VLGTGVVAASGVVSSGSAECDPLLRERGCGPLVSLFGPINRLMFPEPCDRFYGYDVTAIRSLAQRVKRTFERLEDSAAVSMMDFDDRDLIRFAELAGFERVHVECHIDLQPEPLWLPLNVEALLDSSPNPLAPTVRETIAQALTQDEQSRFIARLAHAIIANDAVHRSAVAYLTATKGSSTVPLCPRTAAETLSGFVGTSSNVRGDGGHGG
jgi:arsenite methyltransferase